jgi:hypothetical protein
MRLGGTFGQMTAGFNPISRQRLEVLQGSLSRARLVG